MAVELDRAIDLVNEFVHNYPVVADIEFTLRDTQEQLYGPQATVAAVGKIQGAYYPASGRAAFALANFRDADEFEGILRHEIIGHFGINTFTEAEKQTVLTSIIAARNEPTMAPLWERIERVYPDKSASLQAEELFAFSAEGIANDATADIAAAARVWSDVCESRTRTLTWNDLNAITSMVAQGLRSGTRGQQVFPLTNSEQFRKEDSMEKKSFHELVADQLIEQLKQGTAPWQKPWAPGEPSAVFPMNPTTGNRYKGINAIYLMAQGHDDQRWLTYKQAAAAGAQVRKGEHGTPIQYWKFHDETPKTDGQGKPVLDARGEPVMQRVKLERPKVFHATVFNAEQIDGLPLVERHEKERSWSAVERAEAILAASGATIKHEAQNRAFYRPATNSIHLPEQAQFPTADGYYATALHELGHWTGHESRLARDLSHPFGSEGYAKEELRAEIASMIVGDELGIGHDPSQHAAYVSIWIKVLENDPLEIFRAAADAEKIHAHLLGLEQQQVQEQGAAIDPPQQAQEARMPQTDETNLAAKPGQSMDSPPSSIDSDQPDTAGTGVKTYLDVSYKDKNTAKNLGAKWDRQEQSWFVPANLDPAPFAKWIKNAPEFVQAPRNEIDAAGTTNAPPSRQYLAVPYDDREAAKASGALWDKVVKSWYVGPQADAALLKQWAPENVRNEQAPALHPRDEFAEAMRAHGLVVEGEHPIMDGNKHRVPVEGGKKGSIDGFYVLYPDGHPAGRIINNKTGSDEKWKSKGYSLTPEQKAVMQAEAAANLARRAVTLAEKQEQAAARVSRQFDTLDPVEEPTPYLAAKGVQAHPGAFTDVLLNTTFIPVIDTDNKLWSMQYIQEDGTKRFAKDSRKEGCFHAIGGLDALAKAPVIVISEGYATAATLAEVLGFATVAAFDSGNLTAVAKAMHAKFPDKPIVVAGDDDHHQEVTEGKNPGREKMEEAAKAVGATTVLPIFAPGEREAQPKAFSDFNDLATKSALGRAGVERQVRAVVEAAIDKRSTVVELQEDRKLVQTEKHRQSHRPPAEDEPVRQRRSANL